MSLITKFTSLNIEFIEQQQKQFRAMRIKYMNVRIIKFEKN